MGRVRLVTHSSSESEDERVTIIREADMNREEVAAEEKNLKTKTKVDDEEPMQSQGMEENPEEEEKEGEEEEESEEDDDVEPKQSQGMEENPEEEEKEGEEEEESEVISSVLEPDYEEKDLLRRIVDGDHVDDGIGFVDPVVDSWRNRLIKERKRIFWKDISSSYSLKEAIDEGFKRVMAMLAEHNERLVTTERRQAGESVPPFEKKVHSDVNKEKEE
ncbi:unnamed protein product [Arabidopsis thaliana]|uniref:(thale cress) hypothetical protein n=1 Tax=Arabidopsis thaliana TaxID=3702 RepID=A0A7G2E652_ARATH|nr:unnamed protein product [Arabidopsis thaliana]